MRGIHDGPGDSCYQIQSGCTAATDKATSMNIQRDPQFEIAAKELHTRIGIIIGRVVMYLCKIAINAR